MKRRKFISIMAAAIIAASILPANAVNSFAADNHNTGLSGLALEQVSEEYNAAQTTVSDFTVSVDKGVDSDNDAFSQFTVSYQGSGADALERKTKQVIAMRYAPDGVNYNPWTPVSAYSRDNKGGTSSTFAISKTGSIQFAVTTRAYPRKPFYDVDLSTDANTVAVSEGYEIAYTDNGYVKAPFLKAALPSVQATIRPVEQEIAVQFDEALKVADPAQPVTIEVTTTGSRIEYQLTDINWEDGTAQATDGAGNYSTVAVTTVGFTFTPDKTYQGCDNYYTFKVKNLVGVKSNKEPNEFHYRTSMNDSGLCAGSTDIFSVMNVNKIADGMIDLTAFQGTGILNSSDIVLVAEKDGQSASFDLSFNCLALKNVMKAGKNIKLGVPYPAGFDARDGEVTYKAYYFIKNADGSYTMRELHTQISELGLEVADTL